MANGYQVHYLKKRIREANQLLKRLRQEIDTGEFTQRGLLSLVDDITEKLK